MTSSDLQTEFGEPRMVRGARPSPVPPHLSVRFADSKVIDAGVAFAHQSVLVKLPVLISVRAKPFAGVVMPLIRKAHGDAIAAKRPELLDETVVKLGAPLLREEVDNLGAAVEEDISVAPRGVWSVGEGNFCGVARIPCVLCGAHLQSRGL